MKHQPHLWLPGPWGDDTLAVDDGQLRHLTTVLRTRPGDAVTYTDGDGVIGAGVRTGSEVERGSEETMPEPARMVTIAVAPPKSRDRQRTIAEKLQELGVRRLVWLSTKHGEGRPPRPDRCDAWITSALEQSRSAWRMDVASASLDDLEAPIIADTGTDRIADAYADRRSPIVAIGPEGGWSDGERSVSSDHVCLAKSVLRTDTAAIVAAVAFGANSSHSEP